MTDRPDYDYVRRRLATVGILVPLDVIAQWHPRELVACLVYLNDQWALHPPACLAEYVLDRNEGHLDLWGI